MQIRFINSIHALSAHQWNSLCSPDYPFVRHEFLAALEDSGCTTAASGWLVQHLLVEQGDELLAVLPGYSKTHSYGEYVFDWAWADAYSRQGLDYYPKWINAIPFTPCVGPRLLCNPANLTRDLLDAICTSLAAHCRAGGYSGWHCLFPGAALSESLQAHQLVQRLGCQFHWFNRGYGCFDDFLAQMHARKRKNILKERRQVAAQGFVFSIDDGTQLGPADWDTFYALYRNTYLKRSGHSGYLTADFFRQLGATMPDQLVLISARQRENPTKVIAAALFVRDNTTLYGRYWGCFEEYQFLHFETCYYQGIDYAIAHKLQRFDGGAQGEHKIARGFEPVLTHSNHWLNHPGFNAAIADFVAREAVGIRAYAAEAKTLLPFKAAATT